MQTIHALDSKNAFSNPSNNTRLRQGLKEIDASILAKKDSFVTRQSNKSNRRISSPNDWVCFLLCRFYGMGVPPCYLKFFWTRICHKMQVIYHDSFICCANFLQNKCSPIEGPEQATLVFSPTIGSKLHFYCTARYGSHNPPGTTLLSHFNPISNRLFFGTGKTHRQHESPWGA